MTDAEVAEYSAARDKLPQGISLISAAETAAEIVNIVRTNKATLAFSLHPLSFASASARFWLDRHRDIAPITTGKLVEEFLKAKQDEGCGAKHLYSLKNNLGRFTHHFQCNIADIYKPDFPTWLRDPQMRRPNQTSPSARPHQPLQLRHRQRALPKKWDELSNISVGIIAETDIGTYTPADMEKILRGALGQIPLKEVVTWTVPGRDDRAASSVTHTITAFDRAAFKQNIPFIVTGAFGGLRTAERLRLSWSHFNWDTERIHVTGKRTKGKTTRSNSRRLVPIHPALRDWLEPFIPRNTEADVPLVPYGQHVALDRLRLLCLAVDVAPIENGLRHSYISYRCAELHGDKAKVADESGNSVPRSTNTISI
jgi:hypothetical protein